MSNNQRRYLVIGGTGMLADLCHELPSDELILAARFESNQHNLKQLSNQVVRQQLDYKSEQSRAEFINELVNWQSLEYCILWIHSPAHDFSCELIKTLAQFDTTPRILHVFDTDVDDSHITICAEEHKVPYRAVKLGRVELATGWRWLTNKEISEQVAKSLADSMSASPNLLVKEVNQTG